MNSVLVLMTLMIIMSQHLKNGDIEKVIANFVQSGSKFLLTSNFPTTRVR